MKIYFQNSDNPAINYRTKFDKNLVLKKKFPKYFILNTAIANITDTWK